MNPFAYSWSEQSVIDARTASQRITLAHSESEVVSPIRSTRRKAPATCGELFQGAICGRDFLVNCPIDRYSFAQVKSVEAPGLRIAGAARFEKIRHAVSLLNLHDRTSGLQISVTSDIPRGKGMASSSADITAALSAVMDNAGLTLSPAELTRLVVEVEPSDCVHLPGIAHVGHLNGDIMGCLPAPQGMDVVIVDCGGQIDTVSFDRERARSLYRSEQRNLIAALAQLKGGLKTGSLEDIASAATFSAQLSQRILPKPHFESLLNLVTAKGALGVNCAHSGTVLGVLHKAVPGASDALIKAIRGRFGSALPVVGAHRLIGGGSHAY